MMCKISYPIFSSMSAIVLNISLITMSCILLLISPCTIFATDYSENPSKYEIQLQTIENRLTMLEKKIESPLDDIIKYVDITTSTINWTLTCLGLYIALFGLFSWSNFQKTKKEVESDKNEIKSIKDQVNIILKESQKIKQDIDKELEKAKIHRRQLEEELRNLPFLSADTAVIRGQNAAEKILQEKNTLTVFLAAGLKALREQNFLSAITFFDACQRGDPHDALASYYSGTSRLQQALQIDDISEKKALLGEAENFLSTAIKLKKGFSIALNDLGKLFEYKATLATSAAEKEKLFSRSESYYTEAWKHSKNYTIIYNMAGILSLRASNFVSLGDITKASECWERSDSMHEEAAKLEIHHGPLWFRWLLMLNEWAKHATPDMAKELKRKQTEITEKGLRWTPDYFEKMLGMPPKTSQRQAQPPQADS